jgi:hypothetical protein
LGASAAKAVAAKTLTVRAASSLFMAIPFGDYWVIWIFKSWHAE